MLAYDVTVKIGKNDNAKYASDKTSALAKIIRDYTNLNLVESNRIVTSIIENHSEAIIPDLPENFDRVLQFVNKVKSNGFDAQANYNMSLTDKPWYTTKLNHLVWDGRKVNDSELVSERWLSLSEVDTLIYTSTLVSIPQHKWVESNQKINLWFKSLRHWSELLLAEWIGTSSQRFIIVDWWD